jgi:uncharacterized protein (TIGR02145 family)
MRKIVLLLGLVVLTACSTSDYEFINIQQTIRDVQDCSLNKTNQSKSCSQMASIEYDSFGRIRYTEMLGNSISIYWHPYNLSPAEILAIRIQNNESDEWYNASGEELGVFKSVFVQTYGNTFSNNILNFFIGLIYDETPTPVIEGANLNTENENVENKENEEKYPNTDIIQGVFTDKRDGKQYKYTVIGTQTWMAENLKLDVKDGLCYNDITANCEKYGVLYTAQTANCICPEGWNLPDEEDWVLLALNIGATKLGNVVNSYYSGENTVSKLKSVLGWESYGGTNELGFSAFPVGKYSGYSYEYSGFGETAYFMGKESDGDVTYAYITEDKLYTNTDDGHDKDAMPVRCMQTLPCESSNRGEVILNVVCSNKGWREATSLEKLYGGCVAANNGDLSKDGNYRCGSGNWVFSKMGEGLVDSRDGQTYKTVVIGNQEWMAENLNYETVNSNSYCYKDNSTNCEKYGRLYTWEAAKEACPPGWHLPTEAEFKTLLKTIGGTYLAGKMLKTSTDWDECEECEGVSVKGEDPYGFSALPAGEFTDKGFSDAGSDAFFWSATENDEEYASTLSLYHDSESADLDDDRYKENAYSVRCRLDIDNESTEDEPENDLSDSLDDGKGTLTDSRDGQTYKIVKIGHQIWMAENLNYSDSINYPSMLERNWCYNNNLDNCAKFGRLYTWSAAMDSVGTFSTNGKGCGYGKITCSPTYPVRGICPEGWHLPTKAEFKTLFTNVGGESTAGKMLKATNGWNSNGNGTDASGFSALPAGNRFSSGSFNGNGNYARFWSAIASYADLAYYLGLSNLYENADLVDLNKDDAYSVRCLKD